MVPSGRELFELVISAAKEDPDHPRKAVLRALLHRGGYVLTTEDMPCILKQNTTRTWTGIPNVAYPNEQEED